MRSLNEIALATRLSLFGDRQAFESLVRENQGALRRMFLHLTLGDTMLSDDLAQDTFMKAWLHIDQYSGRASFQTWVFSIGYRVVLDYCRTQQDSEDIDEAFSLGRTDRDIGLQMDMAKALKQLKTIDRTCVTLQVIEGMKTEDIAKVTDLNANTVRSHIARGKQKLAEYLKQNGYE